MQCKRCMVVMGPGTRYEQQKGRDNPSHRRYFECGKCRERVYVNIPNFQEMLEKVREK